MHTGDIWWERLLKTQFGIIFLSGANSFLSIGTLYPETRDGLCRSCISFSYFVCAMRTKHLQPYVFECAEVVNYAVNPQYLWVADKNWRIELKQISNSCNIKIEVGCERGGTRRRERNNISQDKNNKPLKPKENAGWMMMTYTRTTFVDVFFPLILLFSLLLLASLLSMLCSFIVWFYFIFFSGLFSFQL